MRAQGKMHRPTSRSRRLAPAVRAGRCGARALAGLGIAVLASGPAQAADVEFDQQAGTEFGYSDNIDLAPDDVAEGSFYNRLSHSAAFKLDGNRLDLDLLSDIALEYQWAESDTLIDQNVRGRGKAELYKDWFFLDFGGSSTRQLVNDTTGGTAGGRVAEEDRATVNVLEASPYLSRTIGSYARGEVRYRRAEIFVTDEGDSGDASDRSIDEQRVTLASGPRFDPYQLRGEGYHVDNRAVRDEQADAEDLEILQGAVTALYALNRTFAVLATVGAAEVDVEDDRDFSGPLWDVGVEVDGARLDGTLTVGERYNEPRVSLDARYQATPKTGARATLTRELEVGASSVATLTRESLADPTAPAVFPTNYARDVSNGAALTWNGEVQGFTEIGRNKLRLGVRYSDREFADGSEESLGGRLTWERGLSRFWTTRVTVIGEHFSDDAGDTDAVGARLELVRKLTDASEVYAGYAVTDQVSDNAADEYTENILFVGGRIAF